MALKARIEKKKKNKNSANLPIYLEAQMRICFLSKTLIIKGYGFNAKRQEL